MQKDSTVLAEKLNEMFEQLKKERSKDPKPAEPEEVDPPTPQEGPTPKGGLTSNTMGSPTEEGFS